MIAWFARNHVAANLLMAAILAAGLASLATRVPLEIFPTFQSDIVSVRVALRGATPEEAEQGIAIRIEEALQDLEGIETLSSQSTEGGASIRIEVASGYDPRALLADIKGRVDALNTLPAEAERPRIELLQRLREVISVVVAGDHDERRIRAYAEQVRDELLALPDVTQIALDGVRDYEVAVEVSQDALRRHDLTVDGIARRIAAEAVDLSAGAVRAAGGDLLIRSNGQAERRDQFARIVVKTTPDGGVVRLGDVAAVRDGFEETPLRMRFNGKPAVLLDVQRVGRQSAIEVAEQVKGYIARQQATLPVGITLGYWDDDSRIVRARLGTLTSNAIQGGLLVLALLALFLRPAIAFWVFMGIPLSFMGAFLLMPFFGVTLNLVSLFGFILVLGIVVDDAIVTGENIYRRLQRGEEGLHAAIEGTREVAVPVTFGILTTVAAFLPLAFIEGMRGPLFAQIPLVVAPVLLFSLIESKLILPAHLKYLGRSAQERRTTRLERWRRRFADGLEQGVLRWYRPLLQRCLNFRYSVLALFVGLFILLLSVVFSGWSRFVFFPRVHSESARATLTMPVGAPFEATDRQVTRIAEAARTLQQKYRDAASGEELILNILSSTGAAGGDAHIGRVRFEIAPPDARRVDITSAELVQEWRALIGAIPGARSVTYRAEIGRGGDPIDVELRADSAATLERLTAAVKAQLLRYPTVFNIADSMGDQKEGVRLELTAQGEALGLTRAALMAQVRDAFFGAEAQRIQRGREEVRVVVRLPLAERRSVAALREMMVVAPDGSRLPLARVAHIAPDANPAAILRTDRRRTVNVTADVDKKRVNMEALRADLTRFLDGAAAQYPAASYELKGEAREQRQSLGSLKLGLLFVLFAIYTLLAVPMRSYAQPLIVMSIIPFGAIGALLGHWIMGMDVTIMSLFGLLALSGVVVNDSLMLVDFINRRRREGADEADKDPLTAAILTAGAVRFRPVLLTSLTTFIGLMPLLFDRSTQAQFLIPMAVSLGFGILFATLITLFMVPANYLILEDLRGWFARRGV